LASYVVAWPGKKFNVSEIKTFLKSKLPHYMIPTYLIQIPALPLTPNGKIDRKALPKPVIEGLEKTSIPNPNDFIRSLF